MKRLCKRIGKNLITGLLTAGICVGALFLTSLIPQTAIYETSYESACYFAENELFPNLKKGLFFTRQDNYADCILTHIIYQIDEEKPIQSSLMAAYYFEETENVNVSFLKAVEQGLDANTEYVRYWHGSMVFLRPLFTIMSVTQIRIALAIVVLAEMISVIVLTLTAFKGKISADLGKKAALCFVLALLLVHSFMIAASIEYVTTFIVMGAILLALLLKLRKNVNANTEHLFIISGVVTCFVDFLTTETITFTIPMAFLLLILYDNGKLIAIKEGILWILTNGIGWFCGYAGMFAAKWTISGLLFGQNTLYASLTQAGVRLSGGVQSSDGMNVALSKSQQLTGAIWQNLGCLFPFTEEMTGHGVMLYTVLTLLVISALFYLFRFKETHGCLFVPLLLLSLLPYVRFLALSNHACLHYFFTYRAQIIGVFVILLFITMNIAPGIRQILKK